MDEPSRPYKIRKYCEWNRAFLRPKPNLHASNDAVNRAINNTVMALPMVAAATVMSTKVSEIIFTA
jgi:hypothetical protein